MGKKISAVPAEPIAPPAAPSPAAPPLAGGAELWTVPCVARDLGVPVEFVQELFETQCTAGEHFLFVRGTPVFNEAGIARIRAGIEANMRGTAAAAGEAVKPTAPAVPAAVGEDLRLTRVFRWSTNVLAERPNGNEVVVKVKDVTHLEAGMVLAGCVEGESAWFYMGRLPRSIGQRQLYFPPSKPKRTPKKS